MKMRHLSWTFQHCWLEKQGIAMVCSSLHRDCFQVIKLQSSKCDICAAVQQISMEYNIWYILHGGQKLQSLWEIHIQQEAWMWKPKFVFSAGISAHFLMDAYLQAICSQIQHEIQQVSFTYFSAPNTHWGLAHWQLFSCLIYMCD